MKLIPEEQTTAGPVVTVMSATYVHKEAGIQSVRMDSAVVSSFEQAAKLALSRQKYQTFFLTYLHPVLGSQTIGAELALTEFPRSPTYHIGDVCFNEEFLDYLQNSDMEKTLKSRAMKMTRQQVADGKKFQVLNRIKDKVTVVGMNDQVLDPVSGKVAFILTENGPKYFGPVRPAGDIWDKKKMFIRRIANFGR